MRSALVSVLIRTLLHDVSSCFLPEPRRRCKPRHYFNGPTWFERSRKLDARQAKDGGCRLSRCRRPAASRRMSKRLGRSGRRRPPHAHRPPLQGLRCGVAPQAVRIARVYPSKQTLCRKASAHRAIRHLSAAPLGTHQFEARSRVGIGCAGPGTHPRTLRRRAAIWFNVSTQIEKPIAT